MRRITRVPCGGVEGVGVRERREGNGSEQLELLTLAPKEFIKAGRGRSGRWRVGCKSKWGKFTLKALKANLNDCNMFLEYVI